MKVGVVVLAVLIVCAAIAYYSPAITSLGTWRRFFTKDSPSPASPQVDETSPERPRPSSPGARPAPTGISAPPALPGAPAAASTQIQRPGEANPELPFPKPAEVALGVERGVLLESFHLPTIRATSDLDGDLVEVFVYASGAPKDTWVVLREGQVAATFDADHIPKLEAVRRPRTQTKR